MTSSTYPIVGIPVQPGAMPVRREINAWFNDTSNGYQVSLFLQAMTSFMARPVTERLSFFQLAGIHCFPLVGWDGENPVVDPPKPTDPFPGYCNHNRITFPTWHRPYLILYEQVIYEEMINLIDLWSKSGMFQPNEEEKWRLAAGQFRLPYWDWAQPESSSNLFAIPPICHLETIKIVLPGGKTTDYSNPLGVFQNPTKDSSGKLVAMGNADYMGINAIKDNETVNPPLPWSRCVGTSRFGINTDKPDSTWISGFNDWEQVNSAMNDPLWYGNGSGTFADAVSRMFEKDYLTSWETFSSTIHNDPTQTTNTNYMSLEYIHNIVHNTTGGIYMNAQQASGSSQGYDGVGLGHMSDVPVAAFDPIFWFHHCNVDRLAAIWQTLNPKLWFDSPQAGDPTPTDPLTPFHYNTTGSRWTSQMCRDWRAANYNYDDLIPSPDAIKPDGTIDEDQYLEDLRAHINQLYPSTRTVVRDVPGYRLRDDTFHDYIINVIYDRYALKGSAYAILFFLGTPPSDLSSYPKDKNFIGSVYTFSAPIMDQDGVTACDNCSQQQTEGVLSKAQVPLTLPLLARVMTPPTVDDPTWTPLNPEDLTPETVELILERELQWKFVELGGREVDHSELPSTEIAVLHGTGYHRGAPSRGTRPAYRGYKRLRNATRNQHRGYGHPRTSLDLIHDDPE